MKTHAIIIDLDGTALDSPSQTAPSRHLIDIIPQIKRQYFLSTATGRSWSFAKPVLKKLNLTDPCIITAGTQICHPITGKIIWQKSISTRALTQALQILKDYPEYNLLCNDYTLSDYINNKGISPQRFTPPKQVHFLEQTFVPENIAAQICRKLQQINGLTCVMVTAQKPGKKDLHIIHQSATKEQAIKVLLDLIHVPKTNTIGVGDGPNDIHLFNAVHYKVAMGNSVDELKALADLIIQPVSQDGLYHYLRSLLNKA